MSSRAMNGLVYLILWLCFWFAPVSPVAHAADRVLKVEKAGESSNLRTALVIGNGNYRDSPLKNPVNDAKDIADALSGMGFKVTLKLNANQREVKQAIRELGNALRKGGVGFFYFAGHGMQVKGVNYLIPVGVDIQSEDEVEDQSVSVSLLLEKMESAGNQMNVIVLDACRNNPFARSFRSASRGLAQMDAGKGSLIAYATSPGSVASDGSGRNGVYTKYLLESFRHSESDIERVFKRVRASVVKETSGKQVPWESSSLIGDFYFNPKQLSGVRQSADDQASRPDPEIVFWDSIKGASNPADFVAYLARYPEGQFADIARTRALCRSTWKGKYAYPRGADKPDVPFQVQFVCNGQNISGRVTEPNTFQQGSSEVLSADLSSIIVDRSKIEFVKTYDGEGGARHSVYYSGTFSSSRSMKGSWRIPQVGAADFAGAFELSQ